MASTAQPGAAAALSDTRLSAALIVPETRAPWPLPGAGVDVEGHDEGAGSEEEEGEECHAAEEADARRAGREIAAATKPEDGTAKAHEQDDERAAYALPGLLSSDVIRRVPIPALIPDICSGALNIYSLINDGRMGLSSDVLSVVFQNILGACKCTRVLWIYGLRCVNLC